MPLYQNMSIWFWSRALQNGPLFFHLSWRAHHKCMKRRCLSFRVEVWSGRWARRQVMQILVTVLGEKYIMEMFENIRGLCAMRRRSRRRSRWRSCKKSRLWWIIQRGDLRLNRMLLYGIPTRNDDIWFGGTAEQQSTCFVPQRCRAYNYSSYHSQAPHATELGYSSRSCFFRSAGI